MPPRRKVISPWLGPTVCDVGPRLFDCRQSSGTTARFAGACAGRWLAGRFAGAATADQADADQAGTE